MVSGKQFRKRNAILSYLRRTDAHPSAEMVFEHLKDEYPDLSLGTVYRNLGIFKNQGIIQSVGTVNGVERFDGNAEPHVHFMCSGCGDVIDLHQLNVPDALLEQVQQVVGGRVDYCQLNFAGLCRQCVNSNKGGETA